MSDQESGDNLSSWLLSSDLDQRPAPHTSPQQPSESDSGLPSGLLQNDLVAVNQPSAGSAVNGFLREDIQTSVEQLEMPSQVKTGSLHTETQVSRSSDTVLAGNSISQTLPDLIGEESQTTVRDDLTTKLRKIEGLIGNAAEIQKKYEAVSDAASQKSILEMLDKLHLQKRFLERELNNLSLSEQRNESLSEGGHSRPLVRHLSEERIVSSSPLLPNMKGTSASRVHEELSNSVGILRGNLKDVMERKKELEAMVEILRQKLDQCKTKEDQANLTELLKRHNERISELNQTVQEARKTLIAMENLNRRQTDNETSQSFPDNIISVQKGDEYEDRSAEEDTMRLLRNRLKKMRVQVETIGQDEHNNTSDVPFPNLPAPSFFEQETSKGNSERLKTTSGRRLIPAENQSGRSHPFYDLTRPCFPFPPPPPNDQITEQQRFSDHGPPEQFTGDISRDVQSLNNSRPWQQNRFEWDPSVSEERPAPPRSRPEYLSEMFWFQQPRNDSHGSEAHAMRSHVTGNRKDEDDYSVRVANERLGSHSQSRVMINPYDQFDSNQSSDSETEDLDDDTRPFFRDPRAESAREDKRSNNSALFGKRNDLGLPQTPKKNSNSRNWKNGAESGRGGRSAYTGETCFPEFNRGERDHYPQEDLASDAFGCQSERNMELPSRDLPVADMVKSLQLIMTEQQKILNTCAQYVAKPSVNENGARSCTPDQLRGDRLSRGIPMINNTLRNGDVSTSRSNLRTLVGERHGLLNNQRNDARSFSMSPNMSSDGLLMDSRQRMTDQRIETSEFFGSGIPESQELSDYFNSFSAAPEIPRGRQQENRNHVHHNINLDGERPSRAQIRNRSHMSLPLLMKTVLWHYRDDLQSLRYMMESILSLETHASRTRVASDLALIAASEGGQGLGQGLGSTALHQEIAHPVNVPPPTRDFVRQHHDTRRHERQHANLSQAPITTVVPDLVGNGSGPRVYGTATPMDSSRSANSVQRQIPQRSPRPFTFNLQRLQNERSSVAARQLPYQRNFERSSDSQLNRVEASSAQTTNQMMRPVLPNQQTGSSLHHSSYRTENGQPALPVTGTGPVSRQKPTSQPPRNADQVHQVVFPDVHVMENVMPYHAQTHTRSQKARSETAESGHSSIYPDPARSFQPSVGPFASDLQMDPGNRSTERTVGPGAGVQSESHSGSNGSTAEYDMANDYSRSFEDHFNGDEGQR